MAGFMKISAAQGYHGKNREGNLLLDKAANLK